MLAGFRVSVWQPMTSVYVRVPTHPFASVAVTAMLKLPVCVGVPDSVAVPASKLRPGGSVPVSDQVIVPVPPVCVYVCEKGLPAVPDGVVAGSTVMAAQSTENV